MKHNLKNEGAQPLDMRDQSNFNRRDAPRRTVLWPAILHIGDFSFECKIRNFSLSGLKLSLKLPLKEGSDIKIEFPHHSITFGAKIVWQSNDQLGVQFKDKSKISQSVIGDLANSMGMMIDDRRQNHD